MWFSLRKRKQTKTKTNLEANPINVILDEEKELLGDSEDARWLVPREEPAVPLVPEIIKSKIEYFSRSRFCRPLFNRRYFLTEWSSLANHIWHHNRAGREMPRDLRGSSGEVDPEKSSIIVFFKVDPKKRSHSSCWYCVTSNILAVGKSLLLLPIHDLKNTEKPTHLDFMRCFSETLDWDVRCRKHRGGIDSPTKWASYHPALKEKENRLVSGRWRKCDLATASVQWLRPTV